MNDDDAVVAASYANGYSDALYDVSVKFSELTPVGVKGWVESKRLALTPAGAAS